MSVGLSLMYGQCPVSLNFKEAMPVDGETESGADKLSSNSCLGFVSTAIHSLVRGLTRQPVEIEVGLLRSTKQLFKCVRDSQYSHWE